MKHLITTIIFLYFLTVFFIFSGCTKDESEQSGTFIERASAITSKGSNNTNGTAPIIISGRVVDAVSELGLNSVLIKTEGAKESVSRNDGFKDGIFAIVDVPLGPYFVEFYKSGYENFKKNIVINYSDFGKTIDLGDIKLYPSGSPDQGGIKGFVYSKAGGRGVNGVLLTLENNVTAVSSNDGKYDGVYLFPRAPVGTYFISLISKGYHDKTVSVTVERLKTTRFDIIIEPLDSYIGQTIEYKRDITGRVIDSATFLGINGVTVSTEGGLSGVTINDGIWDGRFKIEQVPVGVFKLHLRAPEYVDESYGVTVEYGVDPFDLGEIFFRPLYSEHGTIKGIVYKTGTVNGLNDVLITLEGGLSAVSYNNGINQGSFIFENNAPIGTYTLTLVKAGYISKTSEPFTVLSNNILSMNFYLQQSQSSPDMGTITGNVIDVSRDIPEFPREPVKILLPLLNGITLETKTVYSPEKSGVNGTFTLLNVPPGQHNILARLNNYDEGRAENVISIPGIITRDIEIVIKGALGSIEGYIYHDLDNDKTFNPLVDFPLRGATVEIMETSLKTFSKVNGFYIFEQINLGNDYIISAEADVEGRGLYLKNYIDNIDVTIDKRRIQNADINLIPAVTAVGTGHVTGFVVNTYGEAVENALLEIDPGGAFSRAALSENDGYFFINSINSGTYILKASKENHSSSSQIVVIPDDNSANKLTEAIVIKPRTGNIIGIIYNDRNNDNHFSLPEDMYVKDAQIFLSYGNPEQNITTTSAVNGQYIINNIPYGKRVLKVTHPFYGSAYKDFDINNDNFYNANISIVSKLGGITGEVIEDLPGGIPNFKDPGEVRVKDAVVTLLYGSNLKYTTGSDGCFHFSDIPIGDHLLRVEKKGSTGNSIYAKVIENFSIPNSPVTLGISNFYGAVSGIVRDYETLNTLGGITVEVQGSKYLSVKTDNKSGSFLIGSIPCLNDDTEIILLAWGISYETVQSEPIIVQSGLISSQKDILLKYKTANLKGVIKDIKRGIKIDNAAVSVDTANTFSLSDGTYILKDVKIGRNKKIVIKKNGYLEKSDYINVISSGNNIYDFSLTPLSGALSGRVFSYPLNSSILGATLEVIGTNEYTNSDIRGFYKIDKLSTGKYTILISAASHEAALLADVDIFSGVEKSGIDLYLTRNTGTISGVILSNGTISAAIENAVIQPLNSELKINSTAQGAYDLIIPTGSWNFKYFKAGYEEHISPLILIKSSQNYTYNVQLSPAYGKISGLVINNDDNKAVSDVSVEIKTLGINSKTLDSGSYVLTGVPVGNHTVSFYKYGFKAIDFDDAKITVPGEYAQLKAVKILPIYAALSGRIKDSFNFSYLEDAEIKIKGTDLIENSNSQGVYEFIKIPLAASGTSVEINLAGYHTGVYNNIIFSPDNLINRDFLITPLYGIVNGDIIDSNTSLGISGAMVFLKNSFLVRTTGNDGSFTFSNISAVSGTATIEVIADNYESVVYSSVPVLAGEQTSIIIPMKSNSATLTGIIRNSVSETGIQNARVGIKDTNYETYSQSNGFYTLNNIKDQSGPIVLEVFKNGYSNKTVSGVTISSGTVKIIDVLLEATSGSIVGQIVSNIDQDPVAGATVRITSLSRAVSSDSQGYFELNEILSGTTISIKASAPGFASEQKDNINVMPSEILHVNFNLNPVYGVLSGKVIDHNSKDSIDNATVILNGAGQTTSTDVYGQFEFSNLAQFAGGTIEVLHQGYSRTRRGGISVNPGKTSFVEIAITPNYGSVTGVVISKSDNKSVAAALVLIPETGLIATTESTGYFSFEKVPADDNISLQASALDYDISFSQEFSVQAGKTKTFSLVLTPSSGTVSGRIIDYLTGRGVVNAKLDFDKYNRSTTTDASGAYSINKLRPADNFKIFVYVENYSDTVKEITSIERGKTLNVNFSLTPNYGVLSGKVYDIKDNKGIQGISVTLIGSGLTEATTGTGGFYSFDMVPIQSSGYRVNASGVNFISGVLSTPPISGGSRNNLDIPVSSSISSLAGIITDSKTGNVLSDVMVMVPAAGTVSTRTDSGGYYYLSPLQPDIYGLTVETSVDNYFSKSVNSGPLIAGKVSEKNFTLERISAFLSGVIRDSYDKKGIADVNIIVQGADISSLASLTGGYYEISNLPVNSSGYTVVLSKDNYQRTTFLTGSVLPGGYIIKDMFMTRTTGSLAGEITDFATGLPVSGAAVYIPGSSFQTLTGPAGEYELSNVPVSAGVTIEAVLDLYKRGRFYSGPITPGNINIINFNLTKSTGTISGLIYYEKNKEPVDDALVVISGYNISPVYSDAGGNYSISNVPVSLSGVTIDVYKSGFQHFTEKTSPVTGGKNTEKNIALRSSTGVLTGWVQDSRLNLGISGVLVTTAGGYNLSAYSDGAGLYEITNLPLSNTGITIEAGKEGYRSSRLNTGPILSGTVKYLDFNLTSTVGVITGRVADAKSGVQLSGAEINVIEHQLNVNTDAGGGYVFNTIPDSPAGVSLEVYKNGYYTVQKRIEPFKGGQEYILDFELTSLTGSLAGTVKDLSTLKGLSNAAVNIRSLGLSANTDSSGNFSINNIPADVNGYSLELYSDGYYYKKDSSGQILPGIVTSKDFVLSPYYGSISGLITSSASKIGVSDVLIYIVGNSSAIATSNSSGLYFINNLSESASGYILETRKSNYEIKRVTSPPVTGGKNSIFDFEIDFSTGTLSGIISDSSTGLGISGADIKLPGLSIQSNSDSNGYYSIDTVPVNISGVTVVVSKTGYSEEKVKSTSIKSGLYTALSIVLTPSYGTVIGSVTDSMSGSPIENVEIFLAGNRNIKGSTDALGAYQITSIPSSYTGITIETFKNGFVSENYFLPVLGGGSIKRLNFSLESSYGNITGFILDNHNNIGISGVKLTVQSSTIPHIYSKSDGSYLFSNVPVTTSGYTIEAVHSDYFAEKSKSPAVSSSSTVDFNFDLRPVYGTVAGFVKDDASNSGISGVLLRLYGTSTVTTSQEGGYYTFEKIFERTSGFTIEAVYPGYDSAKVNVSSLTGAQTVNLNINLSSKYGTLTGIISNSVSMQGVLNVKLQIPGMAESFLSESTGYYLMTNVPVNSGGVDIIATVSGYKRKDIHSPAINSGEETNFDFTIDPFYSVCLGMVSDSSSLMPLSGAKVSLQGTLNSAFTDASGSYLITNIPESLPGYIMEVFYEGYERETLPIGPIAGGYHYTNNFSLNKKTAVLAGYIYSAATNLGITGVNITMSTSATVSAITGAGGSYLITGVPVGSGVTFETSASGYMPSSLFTGPIAVNTSNAVNFNITPSVGTVAGIVRVKDFFFPIEDAQVILLDYNLKANTDASGYYEITGVPAYKNLGDIVAVHEDHKIKTESVHSAVQLSMANLFNHTVDFDLDKLFGKVIGSAIDATSNRKLPGVLVTLSNDDIYYSTFTDSNGDYSFPKVLAKETYTLNALKSSQWEAADEEISFYVQPDYEHNIDIQLYTNYSVSIRIYGQVFLRDTDGSLGHTGVGPGGDLYPASGWNIYASGPGYSCVTDQSGRFIIFYSSMINGPTETFHHIYVYAATKEGTAQQYATGEFFTGTGTNEVNINHPFGVTGRWGIIIPEDDF
jgi:hypothetical protein